MAAEVTSLRLWVKRGFNGTPASILLDEDDLVDDVKDAVFRKYPVALARNFDSPDVTIYLLTPQHSKTSKPESIVLAVDENIGDIIRTHYPSGQRVEDALVVQIPMPSQGRKSPYVQPRSSNSPLSGTLALMTQDSSNFEYFPDTPSNEVGSNSAFSADYNQNRDRTFSVPDAHSSSHSSGSFGTQHGTPNNAVEGSFRQAPVLSMNGQRYVRDRSVRPTLNARNTTSTTSNGSGGYSRGAENGITFYPKQARSQRTQSAATQMQHAREDSAPLSAVPVLNLGDERSVSPSVVPLSEQELSASPVHRQASISVDTTVTTFEAPESAKPQSPHTSRSRRDVLSPNSNQSQRPSLARTLTASKLSMVSPAASAHSSTTSVQKLEASVVPKKPDPVPAQQSAFGVGGLLEGVVPPIVVLIVEDNIVNLRILEGFMKKRKIRWLTAMDGREAVDKWKMGGVHLVLMDIQMPVMSGIEAAKEIRRLERTNSIGVFAKKEIPEGPVDQADILTDLHFKSPVIIVALTASSLQSDRHEALAAGCNDFLTKPVSLVWLEKKVLEWGCMQALIDFEGWRKFRALTETGKEAV